MHDFKIRSGLRMRKEFSVADANQQINVSQQIVFKRLATFEELLVEKSAVHYGAMWIVESVWTSTGAAPWIQDIQQDIFFHQKYIHEFQLLDESMP